MDLNIETYANTKIKKFRRVLNLPDLTVGELHAILKWGGVEPKRYEKTKSGYNTGVYSMSQIDDLLNNYPKLMLLRKKLVGKRQEKNNASQEVGTEKEFKNLHPCNNVNYFSNKEMNDASNELLKQQEVFFEDKHDDELFESLQQKNVYITETQYKHFKERLTEEQDIDIKELFKKVKNWLNFENNSDLKLFKLQRIKDKMTNKTHYIAEIYGGLNGCGEWNNYLDDIQYALLKIGNAWIVDLSCDCADDVWTLKVGFRYPRNINEGCWGYEWYDSDQTLDECSVFAKKMLSWVCNSMRKKLKQKYGTPTDYIYGYLGIIRELLNTEKIFKETLCDNDTWFELQSLIEKGYKYCIEHKDVYNEPDKFEKKITNLKKEIDELLNKKYVRENKKDKINENYINKVSVVKKFLDNTFVKADMSTINDEGLPQKKPIVGMKDNNGNVVKNLSPQQLFYLIQNKFKHIYLDKEKRDKFLKQIIIDWYNNKISKEGLLSINWF